MTIFLFIEADNTRSIACIYYIAKYEKPVIILRTIIVHQVQKLNHANALSNYCHHKIMPTLYADRCIVKKQQIISMFQF